MPATYGTDITDEQWELIAPLFAPAKKARPRIYGEREVLNAIFYVLRSGCQWRMLPHDLPHWQSVYYHFRRWARLGTFDQMLQALLPLTRKKGGSTKSLTQCLSTLDRSNRLKAGRAWGSMETRKYTAERPN